MRIAISGPPGSGTTTVAKLVAKKLNYELVSAGELFRQMARERGYSIEEFSKIAEENEEIDIYIDRTQKELAESKENVVVEGRLSAWMVKDSFKIYIFAPEDVRAERIAKREGKSFEKAREEMRKREEYEKRRYMKFYGINVSDWSIYHIVFNSACFDAETIADLIVEASKKFRC